MKTDSSTRTLTQVKAQLRVSYRHLGTWRAVAAEYNLPVRTIYKVAMNPRYYPKSPHILQALHLQAMILAPTCPKHGIVHTTKRCPRNRKPARDLFSMSVKTLLDMLNNRKEM